MSKVRVVVPIDGKVRVVWINHHSFDAKVSLGAEIFEGYVCSFVLLRMFR